jgi:large subunit ribosomal protein L19e
MEAKEVSLKSQRRLAAEILKVGENRVWIDPERVDEVEIAITRQEIRKLIHESKIKSLPKKGISRSRAKVFHAKRKKGLRRGLGKRSKRTISTKQVWIMKIRSLRRRLRDLRERRVITVKTYRHFYIMAGSGVFNSTVELERRIKAERLWRTR